MLGASQVAQWQGICLPVQETQETWVRSPGQEDRVQEKMATHSSVLVWKTPRTDEPGGVQSLGSGRVRQNWERRRTGTQSLRVFSLPLIPNRCTCLAPATGCVEPDSWALHKIQLRLLIWRSSVSGLEILDQVKKSFRDHFTSNGETESLKVACLPQGQSWHHSWV